MAGNLLGEPVEHQDQIDPADTLDIELGHIGSPPLVFLDRSWLLLLWCTGCLVRWSLDQEPGSFHQAINPFSVQGTSQSLLEPGSDSTIAPSRAPKLNSFDLFQKLLILRIISFDTHGCLSGALSIIGTDRYLERSQDQTHRVSTPAEFTD